MSFALENQVKELREENKRLNEALAFYADTSTYQHHSPETFSPVWNDKGEKARKVLKMKEDIKKELDYNHTVTQIFRKALEEIGAKCEPPASGIANDALYNAYKAWDK